MTTLPTSQLFVENPKVIEAIRVNDDSQDSITAVLSFSTPGMITYDEDKRTFSIQGFEQRNKMQPIVFMNENIKGEASSGEYLVRQPDGFIFAATWKYVQERYVLASKLSSGAEGSIDTTFTQRRNQSRRR